MFRPVRGPAADGDGRAVARQSPGDFPPRRRTQQLRRRPAGPRGAPGAAPHCRLSTELEDVTEVEYRQLRLERVVLAGLWAEGTLADAENSLRELAALAETAGSEVLDGMVQRRAKPDPEPSSAPARPWSSRTS